MEVSMRTAFLCVVVFIIGFSEAAPKGASREDPRHPPGIRKTQNDDPPRYERDWAEIAKQDIKRAMEIRYNTNMAKNVILFLGDGLGISTITAARQLKAQKEHTDLPEASLQWDHFDHVGLLKTYNIDRTVPDSAATGTAFMCGEKAPYSTLGVNQRAYYDNCTSVQGNKLKSVLKHSMEAGKWGGVVTQTRITHATPASAYASIANRDWEASIPTDVPGHELCTDSAYQLVMDADNQDIRVVLGGGRRSFYSSNITDPLTGEAGRRDDDLDLTQEWLDKRVAEGLAADKYEFVMTEEEFNDTDHDNLEYLMGLFAYDHMDYEVHRVKDKLNQPSLSAMTEKAIRVLSKNNDGFFLLVEGGRIDQAHHDNNAFLSLHEVLEFNNAVEKALQLTDDEDTLVVVTADHSHVFNMGGYPTIDNDIFGLDNSWWPPNDKKPYTGLSYSNGPGFAFHRTEDGDYDQEIPRINLTGIDTAADDFVQDAGIPLDYDTHGGEEVGVFAHGPMAHLFHATHEQSHVAHVMMYAACVGEHNERCNVSSATAVQRYSLVITMVTAVLLLIRNIGFN